MNKRSWNIMQDYIETLEIKEVLCIQNLSYTTFIN